mmetsp:Transcript_42095/g.85979  ORF Transcript_42095/g.85979 Transcript_42095/m.85979 type:complete len:302 (-) Transcript_42095:362-1267(-)
MGQRDQHCCTRQGGTDGAVPRTLAALQHQEERQACGVEAGGHPRQDAAQVSPCTVPPHPLHRHGDGRGAAAGARLLRVPRELLASPLRDGDLRGGARHLPAPQRLHPRAHPRHHCAATVPVVAEADATLCGSARAQPRGDGLPPHRHRVQPRPREHDLRHQPVDCNACDYDAAQDGQRVVGRAPHEADFDVHVGDRGRVQGDGRRRHPRPLPQVPPEAPDADQLPEQRAARGGRLRVQEGHHRHHARPHQRNPRGSGARAVASLRVHRGLRVQLPLHSDPPRVGDKGAADKPAWPLHPAHL